MVVRRHAGAVSGALPSRASSGTGRGTSPPNWRYPLFPVDGERIDVHDLVRRAVEMLDARDESLLGTALHWAHVLKSEQGPDGLWPAIVNARNGQPCSGERTCAPAALLERLGLLLDTTEFDAAVACARAATQGADFVSAHIP